MPNFARPLLNNIKGEVQEAQQEPFLTVGGRRLVGNPCSVLREIGLLEPMVPKSHCRIYSGVLVGATMAGIGRCLDAILSQQFPKTRNAW